MRETNEVHGNLQWEIWELHRDSKEGHREKENRRRGPAAAGDGRSPFLKQPGYDELEHEAPCVVSAN